ncbi:M1 family metallopeptidase [Paenibacillus oceani]|uniref:M1 family metallopeptidase n=1 Tax=Paenibacillus oceani TaxID=2772510 RepID=A0A927GYF3_9BACL|nr:M1 family metallopeptidase [Paenibacillus oceani]MBD2860389.1 M1 family metallopeptidase [Paenibacillus oceani]
MINRLSKRNTLWLLLILLIAGTITIAQFAERPESPASMSALNEPPAQALEPPAPAVNDTPKPLSKRIVEYHISVQLDTEQKTLAGAQSLTWKNPGSKPVSELVFHLYPNAFQSKKSTFLRESGGKLRNDQMKEDSFGHMSLESIQTEDGVDLMRSMQFIQPDDGNKQDQTLMKIRLPQPVNPGAETTIKIRFSVKLPYVFARMGYVGDFVMAGQWFPKVAVYEPKGTRGREEEGWNTHQYHGNSEFYSDFGMYNVRIQVPTNYTVAATGFPTKPASDDGTKKTYQFYADDVHDFAWAASPNFIYYEEPFSAPNVPGVKIKLYLDPAHQGLKDRYIYAAKRSLAKYSEWFGTYPYSTLSIVIPPPGGNGAGGMEYPTLVTGWEASGDTDSFELERVIVHEIGHQYWYGMVASNEFEEAWLDEGFTSYAEDLIMMSEYGVQPNFAIESSYMTSPEPLKLASWQYGGHSRYAENVYTRAKLVLAGIEKQIGQKTMLRVMKTYFDRWKFKHPTTSDFQAVLESVTKTSWAEYFDQFVYGGGMTDYSIEHVQMRPMKQDGKTVYETAVLIKKNGGHYMDVPVRFHFTDGSDVEKVWDGRDPQVLYTITSEAPLEWAAIDPQMTMILEHKRINNFMQVNVDDTWKARLTIGIAKWIEILLNGLAW